MANNYCQSSSFIKIPKKKLEAARKIVERVEKEFLNSSGSFGYDCQVEEDGVWIHGDYIIPEDIEVLVRALVEELDLHGIYVCSWANTCSKHRIDEFSGGAFALKKGMETVWVDAAIKATELLSQSQFSI